MVQHVQYRDFSAVASLDVPAKHLGWERQRQEGTWFLFELRVARTEGSRSLVLRRELASVVVPAGGSAAESRPELIEHVIEATQGPSRVDVTESRRASGLARRAADTRLVALLGEVRAVYPGDDTVAAVSVLDLGLAWVRAV
jgi:hypothetical protein